MSIITMLKLESLCNTINNIWDSVQKKTSITITKADYEAIITTLEFLETGKIRVAVKKENLWLTNDWIKKAILLYLRFSDSKVITCQENLNWFDKVNLKFSNWSHDQFKNSNIRAVPGVFIRQFSYVGQKVVLMPSFINIGSYIDDNTMIDSGVTVGSCAQIGKNCHISSNVVIGGVLEPINAMPVIIEDNCFIGAQSSIVEGVIIREGSVIAMGTHIGLSTKIVDRTSREIYQGEVPSNSVVVPGTIKSNCNFHDIALTCAIIVKKADHKTNIKTAINDDLRN